MEKQYLAKVNMSKLEELIQQYCPDGVEWKTLGEATIMKRGTSATKGIMQEGDIPVISGGRQPAFYCNVSNQYFGKNLPY